MIESEEEAAEETTEEATPEVSRTEDEGAQTEEKQKKKKRKKADGSPAKATTGKAKAEERKKYRITCPKGATHVRAYIPGTGWRYIKEGEPLVAELTSREVVALQSTARNCEVEEVK